jgi:hypothetical protein
VREQLEHDRVIRLLQQKLRRKYQVAINQGAEQSASLSIGDTVIYPDVMLTAAGHHKPEVLIEVETAESVNHIEAMAQWVRLAHSRAAFHLYVPVGCVEAARRLCGDLHIHVDEIVTYHPIGDEMRFTSVWKAPAGSRPVKREPIESRSERPEAARARTTARTEREPAARPSAKAPASRPAAAPARRAPGNGAVARKAAARRPAAAKPVAAAKRAKKPAPKPARAQKRK